MLVIAETRAPGRSLLINTINSSVIYYGIIYGRGIIHLLLLYCCTITDVLAAALLLCTCIICICTSSTTTYRNQVLDSSSEY